MPRHRGENTINNRQDSVCSDRSQQPYHRSPYVLLHVSGVYTCGSCIWKHRFSHWFRPEMDVDIFLYYFPDYRLEIVSQLTWNLQDRVVSESTCFCLPLLLGTQISLAFYMGAQGSNTTFMLRRQPSFPFSHSSIQCCQFYNWEKHLWF